MYLIRKTFGLGEENNSQQQTAAGSNSTTTAAASNDNTAANDEDTKPPSSQPEEGTMGATLWSVLSSKIGGDVFLAGISLPSWVYEPLSILQRQAEMIEYSDVLTKAAAAEDPVERLAFIAGFAVSGYSATQRYKPDFNPILGETFEYVDDRNNTKFLAEQVSHHPPISALQAINEDNWIFWQNSSPTTKFLGNSIDVDTQGKSHIIFPKRNEHYFYTNPQCTRIHNLIIGTMWIEHFGTLNIVNLDGSLQCTVIFKKSGIFQGTQYKVEGFIIDRDGKKLVKIEGKWNEGLEAKWLEDTSLIKKGETRKLWTIASETFLHDQYNFTKFTVSLNRMSETETVVALPSDSRRRPDRRYLEKGNSDSATYWKKIIEEKQRSDRKTRKEPWQPIWFRKEEQPNPTGEGVYKVWVYNSDYWEQRARKEESLREGDIQFIEKMIPPQVLGTACDFMSYENNYLQVMVQPITEKSIILVDPNPQPLSPRATENHTNGEVIPKNSAGTDSIQAPAADSNNKVLPEQLPPQTTSNNETVDTQEAQYKTGDGNKDV